MLGFFKKYHNNIIYDRELYYCSKSHPEITIKETKKLLVTQSVQAV